MHKIQFEESDDILDIRYDRIFKAVFTKETPASKGALSKLISALIDKEVTVSNINTNEPSIDDIHDRQIRFDINCKTENGELVNVEMSLNPESFEHVRLEFYIARLFSGQDIYGSDMVYDDLKEAYQITILAKEKFFNDDVFLHTFEYYDPVNAKSLNGRCRIITMELSKLDKVVKKPVSAMSARDSWAVYFQYLTDREKRMKINEILEQEEGIAMASEVLINISKDEIERARLTSELKYELDTKSQLIYAEQKGYIKGEQKGEQKGERKGEMKIIDLLKSGVPPEEIISKYDSQKP
ncbi:MAG: Rpn family recombination-promoting nuclease/putative transposase [Treponema sp.]|nr:Rpn family recombination-promoting nuclease/putative transposase [Treponema sp.]